MMMHRGHWLPIFAASIISIRVSEPQHPPYFSPGNSLLQRLFCPLYVVEQCAWPIFTRCQKHWSLPPSVPIDVTSETLLELVVLAKITASILNQVWGFTICYWHLWNRWRVDLCAQVLTERWTWNSDLEVEENVESELWMHQFVK